MPSTKTLTIVLTLDSLGDIPEKQQHAGEEIRVATYSDEDYGCTSIDRQLKHLGEDRAKQMVASELRSWLEDLGTGPYIQSIAVSG